jgi:hypothetical protein
MAIKYGNPRTRSQNLSRFLAFELYSLGYRLNGHKVAHWLEETSLPPRKYFMIRQPLPLGVKLLDKIFPFGAETHTKHKPYSAVTAEEMRHAGKTVEVVEISYQLRIE